MPSPYSLPELYDIAFDNRDFESECDFLLEVAAKHLGRAPRALLELACGPGRHARNLARRGLTVHGMDLQPEMVAYARERAAAEQVAARFFVGDMRDFRAEPAATAYELAFNVMLGFPHLLTNDDILRHFHSTADLLAPGGLYILETAHPRDFYGDAAPGSDESWTRERDGVRVTTHWGGTEQRFDPLTEIDEITVHFSVTRGEENTDYRCPDRLRRCSYQTFLALLEQCGRFEMLEAYGDFDPGLPFTEAPESVRFIPVLRRH